MKVGQGFLNKINDIPLSLKFILIYVVCILIPIISINAVFLDRLLRIVYEREENNYRISLERSKADIVKIIEGGVSVSYSITTDSTLYDKLDYTYESNSEYYNIYDSMLRNRLNIYSVAYDYISSICIYVDNPTISLGGTYNRIDDSVKGTSWYKSIKSTSQSVLIYSYIGLTSSMPKRPIQYISILRNSQGYPSLGIREKILKVDIDPGRICSILKGESDYTNLFIVDGDGNIICTADNEIGLHTDRGFRKYIPDMRDKTALSSRNLFPNLPI
jgi:two-component system, sensor histidine kinase YesM